MVNAVARIVSGYPAIQRAWRILRVVPLALITASTPLVAACNDSSGPGSGCCKICREGKPCGDTCISKTDTCHVGAGCACQG
jgi:hypothetical protein